MKTEQMYCGAWDRFVRVLVADVPAGERQAPVTDGELVCLEIGAHCTGNMCPLGAVQPGALVRRIVKNGVPLSTLHTEPGHCPACDSNAEMILYGQGKAGCSVCGTVGRWVVDHLEPV